MGRRVEQEVGSGIARRVRKTDLLEPDDAADATEIVAWFEQDEVNRTRPWGYHASIIQAIRDELERLRLPLSGLEPGSDAFAEASKKLNKLVIERDTEAWYLIEIAQLATIVETASAAGRQWEAVTRAIQIGETLSEFRLKFKWDEHAIFGRDQRKNLSEGQSNRRRTTKDARFKHVSRLINDGHSLSNACRIAAPDHGVKPETLEKDYQRIRTDRARSE